jgi:hypothetical protein
MRPMTRWRKCTREGMPEIVKEIFKRFGHCHLRRENAKDRHGDKNGPAFHNVENTNRMKW